MFAKVIRAQTFVGRISKTITCVSCLYHVHSQNQYALILRNSRVFILGWVMIRLIILYHRYVKAMTMCRGLGA